MQDPVVAGIIPARNEAKNIEHAIRTMYEAQTIDTVHVIDGASEDDTARIADRAGVQVIRQQPRNGPAKGEALSLAVDKIDADVYVFFDADVHNMTPDMIDALAAPLLDDQADHTLATYTRAAGRVTELTARPLLKMFFPEIQVRQPLAGEYALRRDAIEGIQLEPDWGVESGLLIDSHMRGNRVLEVDLGRKDHDMKDLADLHEMACQAAAAILRRAIRYGRAEAWAKGLVEEASHEDVLLVRS